MADTWGTWRGLCGVYSGPAADGEDDVEQLPVRYKVFIRLRSSSSPTGTLPFLASSRLITNTDSSNLLFAMSLPQLRRIVATHTTDGASQIIDATLPLYPLPNGLSANAGFVQKSLVAKPDEAAGGAETKPEGGMFQPGGVTLSWVGESEFRAPFSTGSFDQPVKCSAEDGRRARGQRHRHALHQHHWYVICPRFQHLARHDVVHDAALTHTDYIVLTQGELVFKTHDGESRVVRAGDVVVQAANAHEWLNETDQTARECHERLRDSLIHS